MEKVLVIAVPLYLLAALVLPTVRAWRRTGVFPLVFHRETGAFQRLGGVLFGLLLLALLLWSLLCALVDPGRLGIWPTPGWVGATGCGLFLVGLGITLVAQARMDRSWRIGIDDRPTELVTGGLFRLSRNPIFTGMLISMFGGLLIAPAAWSAVGFALAVVLIAVQVRFEEQHLSRMHGAEYAAYAARVGRFVPWLGRLEQHEERSCG